MPMQRKNFDKSEISVRQHLPPCVAKQNKPEEKIKFPQHRTALREFLLYVTGYIGEFYFFRSRLFLYSDKLADIIFSKQECSLGRENVEIIG